jgi:hypothetical protein
VPIGPWMFFIMRDSSAKIGTKYQQLPSRYTSRAISNSCHISSLFLTQWERHILRKVRYYFIYRGILNNYIRIHVGKECRRRIQTDIKFASTIICGLCMKILAACEDSSVSRYCRGRQEMICCFLQIIPFRNLNSLFDTAMQATDAEAPLCSPLFGSDWHRDNCRLWSIWRIECSEIYAKEICHFFVYMCVFFAPCILIKTQEEVRILDPWRWRHYVLSIAENLSPSNATLYPTRTESSSVLMWKSQNWHV